LKNENYKLQNEDAPKEVASASSQFAFFNVQFSISNSSCDYVLNPQSPTAKPVSAKSCFRFAVMDPAGTEPGDGKNPCYTVIQVWDVTEQHDMLLVYQYRKQVQTPDAAAAAERIARRFDCQYILIERDGLGLGIVQTIRRSGLSVRAIKARGSKEARAQTAEIRMHAGQIYFLQGAPFLHDLEYELLHFPHSQYSDQVDALAHAAMHAHRMGPIAQATETSNAPGDEEI